MHLVPALVCATVGAASGALAPRLIGAVPDIEPDPSENPEDFPELVPFAVLASWPWLRTVLTLIGAFGAAVLGAVFGLVWGVSFFLVALPYALALAAIDYTVWFLPNRLIYPAAVAVGVMVVAAAITLQLPAVIVHSLLGGLGLMAWYGAFWLLSPRSLALGDVKLGGLLGLMLGPFGFSATVLSVLAAAVVSLVSLIPMRILGNTINQGGTSGVMRAHVPFGPSMILGAWISVLVARALGTA